MGELKHLDQAQPLQIAQGALLGEFNSRPQSHQGAAVVLEPLLPADINRCHGLRLGAHPRSRPRMSG